MSNILIVQGHPDGSAPHYCHALARAYEEGAVEKGHNVETIDLGKTDVVFLRSKEESEHGNAPAFALKAQEAINRAHHLVFIYPLWIGTMPAVLKAWLEQVFRPRFAFEVGEKGWTAKLKGKSARIVVTMGMPAFFYRWFFFAHGLKNFERNIMKFCGISPVRSSLVGSVEAKSDKARKNWLNRMTDYGRRAC